MKRKVTVELVKHTIAKLIIILIKHHGWMNEYPECKPNTGCYGSWNGQKLPTIRMMYEFKIQCWKRGFPRAFMLQWCCLQCKDRIGKCLISAMFRNAITSDTHYLAFQCAFICRRAKRIGILEYKFWNQPLQIRHTHFLSTCQPIQEWIKVSEQVIEWLTINIISQHHDSKMR